MSTREPANRLRQAVVAFVVISVTVGMLGALYVHRHMAATEGVQRLSTAPPPKNLGLPRFGIDYYEPSSYFRACPDWTWLAPRCFQPNHAHPPGSGEPGKRVLKSDLSFVHSAQLGRLMRIWISGNQLMRLSKHNRFLGLKKGRLHDLDTAIRIFHHDHLKLDVVIFTYSGPGARNQFNPKAIDGNHFSLHNAYLKCLHAILRHLAGNRIDAKTVRIVDLQNEAYYQLERYFNSPVRDGVFGECDRGGGRVSSQCVDEHIIHPWLIAMYQTARATTHRFLYTESDSGRLLSTSPAQQLFWMRMYPVDVYDIHMYDTEPWRDQSRWETALNLRKPWFSGEVGCAAGDAKCTYSGTAAASVDHWWLMNLPDLRAQAVLVESKATMWTYRFATPSQTLTPAGQMVQCQVSPELGVCRNRL